jgi:methyltransferase
LFVVLQAFRIWVLASLGPYWTTRIVTVPGAAPVRAGPYRFLRHPNYVIVALEIPALPLALGLPAVALGFGAANLLLLAYRVRIEEAARAEI